jgi:hypothetical protein
VEADTVMHLMCFSPQADVVGGLAVTAIGIDVLKHVKGRRQYMALAALPLMLGMHQLVEAFEWWGLQGHLSSQVGHVATWIYLVFAFVVLPLYLPLAVLLLEPAGRRRQAMVPFVALGAAVSAILLAAMLRGPVVAELAHYHLTYAIDLRAGGLVVTAYVIATCGSLVFSGHHDIALFGWVNLVAVALLARLAIDGFASLWCGWAAITSGAFAIHLRYGRGRPAIVSATV